MNRWLLLLVVSGAVILAACGEEQTGFLSECGDSCDVSESDFAFDSSDPSSLEIIDHMGTPLTSTALTNRDDDYQSTAPNSLTYLTSYIKYLGRMHAAFADNLRGHGLEPCSLDALVRDFVTPCTLQRLWDGGPIVTDVVVPDSIEIHLDRPARWPNGRSVQVCTADFAWHSDSDCAARGGKMVYQQINDLVLAMGFLDIGARCPGAPGGRCRLETFIEMGLNPQHNDVELPNQFPYLAPPHL